MSTVTSCTRTHCNVGKRRVNLDKIVRDFLCDECEGRLERRAVVEDHVIVRYELYCHHCEEVVTQIVHFDRAFWQRQEMVTVIENLPAELKAQYDTPEPVLKDVISALY